MRTAVLLAMFSALAWAQAVPAPAPVLPPGTPISAELKTKLDTQHARVGDAVAAVTTRDVKINGVKVLPKGSTLAGHIAAVVAAESKKSPSHMTVIFDSAHTKQGHPVALRAAIARLPADVPPAMMPLPAMPQPPSPEPDQAMNGSHSDIGVGPTIPSEVSGNDPVISSMAQARNGSAVEVRNGVLSRARGDLVVASGSRLELAVVN